MNLESKVMSGVANIIGFIKQQAKNDLITQSRVGNIPGLTEAELQKICRIVEASIESSFTKSSNEVTSILKEVKSQMG